MVLLYIVIIPWRVHQRKRAMMPRSREWFEQKGCQLSTNMMGIWPLLFAETRGRPCNDCMMTDDCNIWREVDQHDPAPPAPPVNQVTYETNEGIAVQANMTNAEAAEILNISKRQVAKLRRAGQLDGMLKEALRKEA